MGDYDLPFLLTGGVEKICAAIDLAEDLPSSCIYYLGGGVNRQNLPPVIVDQRRQPLTAKKPDDEERNKWDTEQHYLQEDVAKNAVHWPMAVAVWTPPTTIPATPTPSKGTTSTAGQLPSAVGSPALDTLATAAAHVERQTTTTMLPRVGSILGESAGDRGSGIAKPASGVQLIAERHPGLVGPHLQPSAGVLPLTVLDEELTR